MRILCGIKYQVLITSYKAVITISIMRIIGHSDRIFRLNQTLQEGASAHAYLFVGPEAVGKHTIALAFARALIAGQKKLSFIDGWRERDFYGDLLLCAPQREEKKGSTREKEIPIETIRSVQRKLTLSPRHGKYKVLVIDQANMLTTGAQSALLKTLEEPYQKTILILVTHEENALLSTVRSRCERVLFGLVTQNDIVKNFSSSKINEQELQILSCGRPGMAKRLCTNESFWKEQKEAAESLQTCLKGKIAQRLALAENLSKDLQKAQEYLLLWNAILRQEMLDKLSVQSYKRIILIHKTMRLLRRTNVNSRLALENLFLNL